MDEYALQTFLKGAIDNAKERVRRNYNTAIPQYYRGQIQLLLPLCLGNPQGAHLALVAERHTTFYHASTCLTLDMAYNNARQITKPDQAYLEINKIQVEAEYQEVLQNREEIRQYWQEYNRDRFARIAAMPHKPEQEELWAKLEEQKARGIAQKQ